MTQWATLCPSPGCSGHHRYSDIAGPIKALTLGQQWRQFANRCRSCGCVWRYQDEPTREKVILGHYDDRLGGVGWVPVRVIEAPKRKRATRKRAAFS